VSASIAATRIYRAQLHNETVNKHRQNALTTFEAFANAADDDLTKSAVLTQATQCIFSPQHTGFIADDRESTGYPQIFEMVRTIPKAIPEYEPGHHDAARLRLAPRWRAVLPRQSAHAQGCHRERRRKR
jgi:hypothetical protein